MKDWEMIFQTNGNHKKVGIAMLRQNKIHYGTPKYIKYY